VAVAVAALVVVVLVAVVAVSAAALPSRAVIPAVMGVEIHEDLVALGAPTVRLPVLPSAAKVGVMVRVTVAVAVRPRVRKVGAFLAERLAQACTGQPARQ